MTGFPNTEQQKGVTPLEDGIKETPHASAARTATGNTGALSGYAKGRRIRAQLNVTASGGTTPTLDVTIEDSVDGTTWNTIGTFAQLTTTGREVINITGQFSDNLRVLYTIGGGPGQTFTFTVDWDIQP